MSLIFRSETSQGFAAYFCRSFKAHTKPLAKQAVRHYLELEGNHRILVRLKLTDYWRLILRKFWRCTKPDANPLRVCTHFPNIPFPDVTPSNILHALFKQSISFDLLSRHETQCWSRNKVFTSLLIPHSRSTLLRKFKVPTSQNMPFQLKTTFPERSQELLTLKAA